MNTYHIPEGNLTEFEKRIARLVRAAAKTGSKLEYVIHRDQFEEKSYTTQVNGKDETRFFRAIQVTVDGDKPKIAGWEFVGTLEHTDEGNILRLVPNATCPDEYRTQAPVCDHCQLKRVRKDTYLVRHDDGSFKQVGKNCLKDFTGHANPHYLAQLAEVWISLEDLARLAEDKDWARGGGGYFNVERYDLLGYLKCVACVVRTQGRFITRRQSEEWGKDSTAWTARKLYLPNELTIGERINMARDYAFDHVGDEKLAQDALNWTRREYRVGLDVDGSLEDLKASILGTVEPRELNDFEHNLLVVAKGESVERRTFGIAAYLLQNYRIKNNLIEKKTAPVNNAFLGEPKVRLRDLTVECESVKGWNTEEYGWCSLFRLRDEAGHVIVWKTYSVANGNDMVEGHSYVIDATVKAHTDWKGQKQTVVSRLVVKLGLTQPAAVAA